jgi:hydroxymethylbilane synthase
MAGMARGPIDVEEMLPAVAQGAIGIERRVADTRVAGLLAAIHDGPTGLRLAAERSFLARLDGSCETPIAGLAVIKGDRLWLRGELLRPDGSASVAGDLHGAVADGPALGRALADELLGRAGPGFFG